MTLQRQKALDSMINTTYARLHRQKSQTAMRDAKLFSCQWDPGTYSNKNWFIGILATIDKAANIAVDLCPKVLRARSRASLFGSL